MWAGSYHVSSPSEAKQLFLSSELLPETNVHASCFVNALFISMFSVSGWRKQCCFFFFSLLWMHVNQASKVPAFLSFCSVFAHFVTHCVSVMGVQNGFSCLRGIWCSITQTQQLQKRVDSNSCGPFFVTTPAWLINCTGSFSNISKPFVFLPPVSSLCTRTKHGWLNSSALLTQGGRAKVDRNRWS